jgi:sialate O-acetylesterase
MGPGHAHQNTMKHLRLDILIVALLASTCASLRAEVRPNSLFSDGVVLQRGGSVPIWGTASEGEKVTVKFQGQTVSTSAKDGRWLVRLKHLKAGGSFTLAIAGDNSILITNVLVGEVWLCSGQSNMAFPLSRAENAPQAIPAADDPELRLYTVPRGATDTPLKDVPGVWKECTPETATSFSAVAYFFGRDLRRALNVPVGLIHSSVGGTPAEAWTSHQTLESDPALKAIPESQAARVKAYDPVAAAQKHQQALARHKEAVAKARAEGKQPPAAPRAPVDPSRSPRRPSALYNAMIAPLQPFAIAGVIWYQGEANATRAAEYQKLFPAMIRNWREAWGEGDFPFLFVQIAPHERMTPEIREAQLLSWQKVPRTAMAVITDIGNETNIHPTRKEPVGDRLALAARAIAYGQKLEYSGPVYRSMKVKGNQVILSFMHIDGGLEAKGGELKGFTIAGADGSCASATAKIEGKKVIVESPSGAAPTAVRYGWSNTPNVNLFNKEGLPATPFRTDK